METIEFILEIVLGVGSVIGLVWCGIFIGREFGTFEKFILKHSRILKDKFDIK